MNSKDERLITQDNLWEKYENIPVTLQVEFVQSDVDEGLPYVRLEGDVNSLRYLADLLLAVVNGPTCHTHISPGGIGSIFFAEDCKVGIYVHRLPCDNDLFPQNLSGESGGKDTEKL